jgi:hypothetical protein
VLALAAGTEELRNFLLLGDVVLQPGAALRATIDKAPAGSASAAGTRARSASARASDALRALRGSRVVNDRRLRLALVAAVTVLILDQVTKAIVAAR